MEADLFAPGARLLVLAACVALAYTAEAMTGFGSIVIALTLGAQLYPVEALLPLLVSLSILLASVIVARNWRHVDRPLLLRGLLPRMGVGLALGFALFTWLPGASLRPLLAAFVLCVAVVELVRLAASRAEAPRPLGATSFTGVTVGAGFVQGLLASGGPLLVYAVGRLGLPKARFRATLAVVWLTLNLALFASYLATGRFAPGTPTAVALFVPVVAVSLGLGNWLHHRLDEAAFRKAVLVLLAVAGLSLAA